MYGNIYYKHQVFFAFTYSETEDYRKTMITKINNLYLTKRIDLDLENFKNREQFLLHNFFRFASTIDNELPDYIVRNYGGIIYLVSLWLTFRDKHAL